MGRILTRPRGFTREVPDGFSGVRINKTEQYSDKVILAFAGGFDELVTGIRTIPSYDTGWPKITRNGRWQFEADQFLFARHIKLPKVDHSYREMTLICSILSTSTASSQGFIGNWQTSSGPALLLRRTSDKVQAYFRDDSGSQIGASQASGLSTIFSGVVVVRIMDLGSTSSIITTVIPSAGVPIVGNTATGGFGAFNFINSNVTLQISGGVNTSQGSMSGTFNWLLLFDGYLEDPQIYSIARSPGRYFLSAKDAIFRYAGAAPPSFNPAWALQATKSQQMAGMS